MNVAVVTGAGERDLTLELDPEGGTVGDLIAAVLDGERRAGLLVDGRFVAADTALAAAGIRQGSVLAPADGPELGAAPSGVVELRVIGGLHARTRGPFPPRPHSQGPPRAARG